MATTHRRAGELWVLMRLRRLSFGRNPLRRRTDRLEAALLLTAFAVALLVVPAAAIVGTAVRDRAEQAAARERTERHPVRARTQEDAGSSASSGSTQFITPVRVAWLDRSGTTQEGQTDVVIGTKTGAELTIWLDREGTITTAPRDSTDSAALGTLAGMTLPMLAWPLLFALFRLARRPLNRARTDAWAREWEQVSPRWTRP